MLYLIRKYLSLKASVLLFCFAVRVKLP